MPHLAIRSEIQKIWGAEYIIVSNDGLEIVDTSATKGMLDFWSSFFLFLCVYIGLVAIVRYITIYSN